MDEYRANMHWLIFIQWPSLLLLPIIKYYIDYKTTTISVDKNGVHFNYGDVIIRGTGNNYEEFKKMSNPKVFKENFYKYKNESVNTNN